MATRMPLRVALPLWGGLIALLTLVFLLSQPRTPSLEEQRARQQADRAAENQREETRQKGALSEHALDTAKSKP